MLIWPIRRIAWQMQELQRAGAGIARVQELLAIKSKIEDVPTDRAGETPALPGGPLALSFQDVTFGYDDALAKSNGDQAPTVEKEPAHTKRETRNRGRATQTDQKSAPEPETRDHKEIVLQDISFHLRPGTVLGLLGRTGSGKTTLTRLIFRLYDPDQGGVYLGSDGATMADVRRVPLLHLRHRVGMVTQNIQLFNATVRDNLTFFDRDVPDERILQVLRDLGLWAWYESLPEGLDTELESGGGGLSAGEAQLLAFTRIFLQDPGLVILDEASSRLDPATENLIERAVDALVRNRTAIVIAHRLGTVQRADDILILEDGRISEYGARSALAADPESRFYSLLQTGMMEEVLA
jgi:ATP-binding cassette subfamily B protein